MAGLPLPRPQLAEAIPADVVDVIETLRAGGHAGFVVGGSLRDVMLGRTPHDWDLATDARPERILELFPGAVYENAFGTVAVRHRSQTFEITTFRRDHDYADFRRPHLVEFGDTIELDLARRDLTINAMAWGGSAGQASAGLSSAGQASAGPSSASPHSLFDLVDPFGGRADLGARVLRAVGDPAVRFGEDALRMVRAVRLSAVLGFAIEADTLAAIGRHSELVRHLSGERIAAELEKLLAAPVPSVGLRPLQTTGLLDWISPELAAQRGIAQNKVPGEDLWEHTLRSVDAAPSDRPVVRLAALVHDIGKPSTLADGRFLGHDAVGAELATALLARLRFPRSPTERVSHLVRQHMFTYEPSWGDPAVRRFIAKIGPDALDELFELRRADNLGSGLLADAGGLDELRRRVAGQLAAEVALHRSDLAVDGDDLIAELGAAPGPRLGAVLDRLLDAVVEDPTLNERPTLLLLAQAQLAEEG